MRGLTLLRQKASSERAEMNGEESYGEFRCRYQNAPPGARGEPHFEESELDFWVASTLSRTCLKFA